MSNEILIRGLKVAAVIGVPESERAAPQNLLVDLELTPGTDFEAMEDRIEATVDYDAVARRVVALAAERPRHLIETLAADVAGAILSEFRVLAVEVQIRKFILPNTEYVAVRCRREWTDA